ncbi:GtrA family protein [Uliginosibacterium flavum]|uniref:GtrA family protein n=1 Tax=Uliginosibacterium flavum TaxID=1396831 RepID=A0ABV2TJL1_9RHOO
MSDMPSARRFFIFVCVGMVCAAIDILTMQALLHWSFDYPFAVTAGFLAGLFANYLGHAKVTFQRSLEKKGALKFMVVVAVNYLLTMLCVAFSSEFFGNVLLGKIFSLPVVAGNGYFLSKVWVFRD